MVATDSSAAFRGVSRVELGPGSLVLHDIPQNRDQAFGIVSIVPTWYLACSVILRFRPRPCRLDSNRSAVYHEDMETNLAAIRSSASYEVDLVSPGISDETLIATSDGGQGPVLCRPALTSVD